MGSLHLQGREPEVAAMFDVCTSFKKLTLPHPSREKFCLWDVEDRPAVSRPSLRPSFLSALVLRSDLELQFASSIRGGGGR